MEQAPDELLDLYDHPMSIEQLDRRSFPFALALRNHPSRSTLTARFGSSPWLAPAANTSFPAITKVPFLNLTKKTA